MSFERAWKECYIQSLQSRSKWRNQIETVKVGDIVLIKDTELIKNTIWPLGRIIKTFPGTEDQIRAVDVRHDHKTLTC